jgi:carbonic anhydrase
MNTFRSRLGAASLLFLLSGPLVRAQEIPSAAEALERLKAGNVRFAEDKSGPKNIGKERRQELAKGQKPYAIILACADSRVTPELVFDTGLGEIFVVRVAGNVATPDIIGAMEYAVEHLHTPLIIVMGHESCGAVKAAVDGGKLEGNLGWLIKQVDVGKDLPKDPKAALDAGVKNNALAQARLLTEKSPVIKEFVHSKRVTIVPAVYSLSTGKVEWLELKAEEGVKPPEGKTKAGSIEVRLPGEDAKVWIDGEETKAKGTVRTYKTPPLPVEGRFEYTVKATWTEQGKEVSREKKVIVRPGETTSVTFP